MEPANEQKKNEMEGFVESRVKEQFCWILHMWCWANLHQKPIIYIYTYTILLFLVKKRMLIVKPPCLDDYPRNRGSGELTPATNELQGP